MMLSADRVQETSSTVGTGAIALAGATLTSMNTFASAFADGSLVGYVVLNQAVQTEWEKGIGTYSANSIARTYVTGGSNGTSPVNFSAGTKIVMSVAPQSKSAQAYDPTQVYAPGDTVQVSGVVWYSMAVNVGSAPSSSNANWEAMGGGGGGVSMLAGPGLVLNTLTNVIRLAVSGDVQIAGTNVFIPDTGTGSVQMQATGGQPPLSWASSALPSGITLAANGTLSYNGAQTDGTTGVVFTGTDAASSSASKSLNVVVAAQRVRQFWRINITGKGSSTNTSVAEMEIRATSGGTNMAVGGTAFANSIYASGYASAYAFDQNPSTRWAALGSSALPYILGYRLTTASAVNEITIMAAAADPAAAPSAFTIQSSADSTTGLDGTWDDEWAVTGQAGWGAGEVRVFTRV